MIDVNATDLPSGARVVDQVSAENWVAELIQDMLKWRAQCDVPIPDNNAIAAQVQRRALWVFLTKQGEVVGALKTLRVCGLISDRCYRELNQKAINTLIPSVVGGR